MAGDYQTTINSAEVYKEALKGQPKQLGPPTPPPSLPLAKLIPKTTFIIDGFKYASSFSICYFLTHFHSDHYTGLTPNWSKGIIFCSPITAQLLIDILNLPKQFIQPLPLSQRLLIDDAEVILLDANHCPGAVQFLFKIPNRSGFQKYLHTGDFRYCHQMKSVSLLNDFSGADAIFLDTTYCHPKFQFPSQDESIHYVVEVINRISVENEGNVLFLVATYIVGKERILVDIARRCKRKVYVDSKKMAILRVLGLGERGMFSEDMSECDVHVVGWNVLGETWPYFRPNFVKTREIMEEGKYSKVVGFVPTGWTYEVKRKTFDVRSKDSIEIHLVPYSEHSNYEELREYVKFLKPKRIIPTVGVDVDKYDSKHANAMRKHFAGLLDEMAIKHEFLSGFKRISPGENERVECLEASDTMMQEHEKTLSNMNSQNDVVEENVPQFQCASQESSSQDLSEISMNETIQELTDCLPSWVTRHQMIGLLKDSGRNVVEAVSNFYEHETEFHAVASASTSSNFVNPVTLLDKDCVDPKASLGKDGPPCKLTEYESASPSNQNVLELAPGSHVPTLSQTCKLSSVGNLKRDAISPGKRKKSTSMNKQSKKSSTKLNLEKQHTITKFFTKMAPLGSKENNETAMPKESEMYKEVVDQFIQVVNGDNTLRSHALTFIEEAKGDLDVALDLYYTRLGVEDTEKENCSETIELLPSQRNQRVSHSGQDMEVAKREERDTDVSLLDHASDRLGLSYVSLPPERYSPVEDACWKDGQAAPYIHLARTFDLVEDEKGKIKATSMLCNMFRSLLVLSPSDVLPALYLCLNKIAPDHENMELNIGSSTVVAALEEACGTNKSRIRELYNSLGDLGDVAQLCRQSQSLLVAPAPLTIRGVYDILRKISVQTGSRSTTRKKNIIVNLICSCREKEMKFLVRTLVRNLRIGAMTRTVLPALAQAIAMNSCSSERIENIKTLSAAVVEAYNIIPDLNILIPMLLEKGTLFSSEALLMVPGVPIKPMLAKIANGASQILKTFENKAFTCEYKYDGQRAQIHRLADGTVHVFSRNGDKTTSRFPDLVSTIKELCDPAAETFILDAEVVAIDRKNGGKLKSFQELSSRERGNKDSLISIDNIKVDICIFVFDVMLSNGVRLLGYPLRERKKYLTNLFQEKAGYLEVAREMIVESDEACPGNEATLAKINSFLEEALHSSCEGIMVKSLDVDAGYAPSMRSDAWLKVKRDYVDGLRDSLDLVPIGAWYGNGRKAGWMLDIVVSFMESISAEATYSILNCRTSIRYVCVLLCRYSPFLMACYNPDTEEYQSVCRVMSGFSDSFYIEMKEFISGDKILAKKPPYYRTAEVPDKWFSPELVWEIRGADLTVSPVHHGAYGLVHLSRGISVRFPRFIRSLSDRKPDECSTATDIADMFHAQTRKMDVSGK